jgi:probable F420-dependent oxidoreductase
MEIGVQIPHTGSHATPEFVRTWCTLADQAGYGTLWGIDHMVMPQRVESKYVLPRKPASIAEDAVSDLLTPNFELMTTLAYVSAVTSRVKIGSSVAVLSIRNAVLNARQLATIDRYSGGRVIYGAGVGWLKEEADAMGMPWDRRGARADEHIALLRAIWTAPGKHVEFHGEFWDIPPMDPEPRPAQSSIPILIGGHSEAAIDRAARLGDGWIAAAMSPERLSEHLDLLRAAALRHDRDPASVLVYCGASGGDLSLERLHAYAELGVQSLQVGVSTLDSLKRFGDEILPKLS